MNIAEIQNFLEAAGFTCEVRNEGKHLVLRWEDQAFDYWPTTGKAQCYARIFPVTVQNLVKAIKSGRIGWPDDASSSTCNACGEPIWWVKSYNAFDQAKSGRNTPLNRDGSGHFSSCRGRNKKPQRRTAAIAQATEDFLKPTNNEPFDDEITF